MRLLGPLRERDFALLWAGLVVSLLGDGIYLVALAFAVLEISDGPTALALVGLAWSLGMVTFLLTGGVLADRHDKRRIMLAADAIRLVALVVAGALSLSGSLELWHLVLVGLVYGIGEGLVGPALGAIVPELVPEPILLQANALAYSARPLALRMAGPALGGLIVAVLGTGGALLIDAATFAVSIACLLAIRARPVPAAAPAEPLKAQLREAVVFVRSQTWLWATLIAAAISLLVFMGPAEVLLPFRIKSELGAGAGAFGIVLAASGAGSLVGSLTVGHLGTPRREITFLYWTWGTMVLALCGYALADHVWQLVACGVFYGLMGGAANPIWATLMQVRVPAGMRGRVASLDWLVSVGLTPVSFALTGPLAATVGAEATLLAAGLIGTATTLAILYLVPGLRAEDGGLARAGAGAGTGARPEPVSPEAAGSGPR